MKQDVGFMRMTRSPAPAVLGPLLHQPTLMRVLDILGPGRAAEFLGQFHADLDSALQTLRATAASPEARQRAAHGLIGLAGTVGASDLGDAARRLHAALQSGDDPGPTDLADEVASLTACLMDEGDAWRERSGR